MRAACSLRRLLLGAPGCPVWKLLLPPPPPPEVGLLGASGRARRRRAGLKKSHFLAGHIMAFEPQKDWYRILGAEPSESLTELKQKYQKLVLLGKRVHFLSSREYWWNKYHPDKQSADVPAGEVEERVQRFIEIDQAWKILGNEETKKEYDLQRHEDDLMQTWPVDAQIYLEDMSWNKDEHCYRRSCRCGGKYTVSRSEAEEVSLVCCDTCSLIIEILR
ncbi:dnaJ homolog subfamily C member 24 isoform X3 [Dermochelys coriacea]|uniref:dnaJ homolog subfamily C member 24 isoform X3 n=1 Tax=Dermochelys coriacea TaxID=27794 RepID=UPI001CA91D6D|nr:dnaJ homolog subfamily C member 24 isoform X3 [Dermochelys coriacea]